MASTHPSFKALLFAISLLAPSTIAQNVTNSTDSCSSPNEAPTPINGTASAKLFDDLYVSLTFGDLRFREPALEIRFNHGLMGTSARLMTPPPKHVYTCSLPRKPKKALTTTAARVC
jgi:hypothetical protein